MSFLCHQLQRPNQFFLSILWLSNTGNPIQYLHTNTVKVESRRFKVCDIVTDCNILTRRLSGENMISRTPWGGVKSYFHPTVVGLKYFGHRKTTKIFCRSWAHMQIIHVPQVVAHFLGSLLCWVLYIVLFSNRYGIISVPLAHLSPFRYT